MKKLLGVSIAAMLAVTPMFANAAQTAPAANANAIANVTAQATDNNKVASVNYVKGAYNAVQANLRNIATDIDLTAVTTSNGAVISAGDSVADNLDALNTAVVGNTTNIGNMQLGNTFGADVDTLTEAVNELRTDTDTVQGQIGTLSYDGFGNGVNTIGAALQELKTNSSATDGKVVAVWTGWNDGGNPTRTSDDYIGLSTVSSLVVE